MKCRVGDIVIGRVSAIKEYGAFIVVDKKINGLLHISEISHGYVKEVSSALSINDELKLKVIAIDDETKKIIFSKKALEKPKRKTKKREKNLHNEKIMETATGFKNLRKMLPYWIEEYNGGK